MKTIPTLAIILLSMTAGAILHDVVQDYIIQREVTGIADEYYFCGKPVSDIYTFLDVYCLEKPYVRGEFDCSNMAAYFERVVEKSGNQAQIRRNENHAWIMVKINEDWIAYECTTCEWKPIDNLSVFVGENASYYYGNTTTYNSIYDIRCTYPNTTRGQYMFNREWAWKGC